MSNSSPAAVDRTMGRKRSRQQQRCQSVNSNSSRPFLLGSLIMMSHLVLAQGQQEEANMIVSSLSSSSEASTHTDAVSSFHYWQQRHLDDTEASSSGGGLFDALFGATNSNNEPLNDTAIYELETTFVINSNSSSNNGVMFDIQSSQGNHEIAIVGIDVHTDLVDSNCPIVVFGKNGTYSGTNGTYDSDGGYFNVPEAWTLLVNSTIECKGLGQVSTIPSSEFMQLPILKGGESYALYTYMPTPNLWYTDNGAQEEGTMFASSTYLSIHQGIGITNLFAADNGVIEAPRVWNGNIKYQVMVPQDDNDLPPPITNETCEDMLSTTYDDNLGSYGNMFDVLTNDVAVEVYGVDFYTDLTEPVVYEIFTKSGATYRDSQPTVRVEGVDLQNGVIQNVTNVENLKEASWTLLKRGSTLGLGAGVGTPVRGFIPFTIPPNTLQAFYVTLETADIRYRDISVDMPNAKVGESYFSNDDLEIQIGVSVGTYPATDIFYGPRVWSGAIAYRAERSCPSEAPSNTPTFMPSMTPSTMPSSMASETPSTMPSIESSMEPSHSPSLLPTMEDSSFPSLSPTSTPSEVPTFFLDPEYTNCTDHTRLEATMAGGTSAYGIFFSITSKEQISITTLDLHIGATTDEVIVQVYTREGGYGGFELDVDAWRLISDSNVTAAGLGEQTLIAKDDFEAVHVKANETRSFYVTVSVAELLYTRTSLAVGEEVVANQYLSINSGAGVASPAFGDEIFESRVFNGGIHFLHDTDCIEHIESSVTYSYKVQHAVFLPEDDVLGAINGNIENTIVSLIDETMGVYQVSFDLELSAVETVNSGLLCEPTGNNACTTIETTVTIKHLETLDGGKVKFEMLQYEDMISTNLNLDSRFEVIYDGDIPVQSQVVVTMTGNFADNLTDAELVYFEAVTNSYLAEELAKQGVDVLAVGTKDQTVADDSTNGVRFLQRSDDDGLESSGGSSIAITTVIDGSYRPPPEIDFSAVVEDSLDADGGQDFQEALVNGRRDISEEIQQEMGRLSSVTGVEVEALREPSSSKELPLIPILGGVMGAMFLLFILTIFFYYRRQKRRRNNERIATLEGTMTSMRNLSRMMSSKGGFDEVSMPDHSMNPHQWDNKLKAGGAVQQQQWGNQSGGTNFSAGSNQQPLKWGHQSTPNFSAGPFVPRTQRTGQDTGNEAFHNSFGSLPVVPVNQYGEASTHTHRSLPSNVPMRGGGGRASTQLYQPARPTISPGLQGTGASLRSIPAASVQGRGGRMDFNTSRSSTLGTDTESRYETFRDEHQNRQMKDVSIGSDQGGFYPNSSFRAY